MRTGESRWLSGDVDGAIAAYTQAIRLDPKNAEAYAQRARMRACTHELGKAIADYTEAIRLDPKNYFAYCERARICEMKGDVDKAIADWTIAIPLAPPGDSYDVADIFFARGWFYGKKGELDKAIADYSEVVRRTSFDAYVHCCRASMYEKKGELDKAIADYTEAVRLRPDNAYMFIGRARLYRKKGALDEAIADCTEAIRLKPDFAAAYYQRGFASIQKGDVDSAIADATEAIRLDPQNAAFYSARSLAYAKKGVDDKASADRNAALRFGRGGVVDKQGDASFEIARNDVGVVRFSDPLCSKYVPSVDNGDGSHRFSDVQLKEMAKSSLDRRLFLQYIEAKWRLTKLKAHCTQANVWPEGCQNLVPEKLCFNEWKTPVHEGKQHGFDAIYVYVSESDGKSNYVGSATPDWRRWKYSLNMVRGKDHWAIIEGLPNDFMDNPAKYGGQRAVESK